MYPVNHNQYRPRRSSRWPYVAVVMGALGVAMPFVVNKIPDFDNDSQPAAAAPGNNIKPAAAVTPLDQATMRPMRDAYPSDQVFIKNINGIDYAWPAGRPHRDLFKIALPCNVETISKEAVQQGGISCHGDPFKESNYSAGDNYAMDFVYRDAGTVNQQDLMYQEPVRAITDGEIVSIKQDTRYNDNCSAIQFQSKDGYIYYYGHLSDEYMVAEGQQVAAGQQIAKVGEDDCGQGVAHLHLDRGMLGHNGGNDDFRDPGTIAILQDLYFSLPE